MRALPKSLTFLLAPVLLLALTGSPAAAGFALDQTLTLGHSSEEIALDRSGNFTLVRELELAAGTYAIVASATLDGVHTLSVSTGDTTCRLTPNSVNVIDQTTWALNGTPDAAGTASMVLQGTWTSSAAWSARLECASNSNVPVNVRFLRIAAIRGVATGAGAPRSPRLASAQRNADLAIAATTGFRPVTSLSLPAGRWLVFGKTNVRNTASSATSKITCRLAAGSNTDQNVQSFAPTSQQGSKGEVAMHLAHVFGSTGNVNLQCGKNNRAVIASHARLVAVRVSRLIRVPLGETATTNGTGEPTGIAGFRPTQVEIAKSDDSFVEVGSVAVPQGLWLFFAKARLKDQGTVVGCTLHPADNSGSDHFVTSHGGPGAGSTGLNLVATSLGGQTDIKLRCLAHETGTFLTHVRITAVGGDDMSARITNLDS